MKNREKIEKQIQEAIILKDQKMVEFDAREKNDRQKLDELRLLVSHEKDVIQMELKKLENLEKQYKIQAGEDLEEAGTGLNKLNANENTLDFPVGSGNDALNKSKGEIEEKSNKQDKKSQSKPRANNNKPKTIKKNPAASPSPKKPKTASTNKTQPQKPPVKK